VLEEMEEEERWMSVGGGMRGMRGNEGK